MTKFISIATLVLFFLTALVGCEDTTVESVLGRACVTDSQCGPWKGRNTICTAEKLCNYPSSSPLTDTTDIVVDPCLGKVCDDGIYCNGAEACKEGLCVKIGIPPCGVGDIADGRCVEGYRECGSCAQLGAKWCDDGVGYTTETCDALVGNKPQCRYWITAGMCGIGSAGYHAGTKNPNNACQVCDPTKDQTWWTTLPDCEEVVEPNDQEVVDTTDTHDSDIVEPPDTVEEIEEPDVDETDVEEVADTEDVEELDSFVAPDTLDEQDVLDETDTETPADTVDLVDTESPDTLEEEDSFVDLDTDGSDIVEPSDTVEEPEVDDTEEVTAPDVHDEEVFTPLCEDADCDDQNPCTDDHCNPQLGCENTDNNIDCDDQNPCTSGDLCVDGACVSGTNLCQCQNQADCLVHEDSNVCNGTLICLLNLCVIDPQTIVVCEESPEPCYEAACIPETGECGLVFQLEADCSDQNPCNGLEVCDPDQGCVAGTPPEDCCETVEDCADDSVCTIEVCEANTCVSTEQACDDDDVCTIDLCEAIEGCITKPLICDDGLECTLDTCLSKSGIGCIFYDSNGADCEDGNPCTLEDTCFAGFCTESGPVLECDDNNKCTVDSCDPVTACQFSPLPPCDDGDLCTVDSCNPATGLCQYLPVVCNDQVACTVDSCNPATGACQFKQNHSKCNDPSNCTVDFCDPIKGCFNIVFDPNPPTPGNCYLSNIDKDLFQDSAGADLDMDCPLQFKDDPAKCDGYCDNQADYEIAVPGPPAFYYEGQTCKGVDNCPWVYNPSQLDSDNDGLGDACDPYNGIM